MGIVPDGSLDRAKLCLSTQLSIGFVLRWVDRLRVAFEGDVLKGLVFVGLVQGNVGHLDRDPDQSLRFADLDGLPPDDLRRPMRMLALAESLGLPRESVRRKVSLLVAADAVVSTPRGYYVPGSILAGEINLASLAMMMANLQTLLDGLTRAGAIGLNPHDDPPRLAPLHRLVGRLTTDYGLRSLEDLRIAFDGEMITGLVFLALANANLPPEAPAGAGPRPISVQALAGVFGLPRETMRRHVRRLNGLGLCVQTASGLLVIDDPLSRPELQAAARRNEAHVRLLMSQLRRSGVLPGAEAD